VRAAGVDAEGDLRLVLDPLDDLGDGVRLATLGDLEVLRNEVLVECATCGQSPTLAFAMSSRLLKNQYTPPAR
jgi:hypothetical protein